MHGVQYSGQICGSHFFYNFSTSPAQLSDVTLMSCTSWNDPTTKWGTLIIPKTKKISVHFSKLLRQRAYS